MKYKLASELLKEEFNIFKEKIQRTLDFISKYFDGEILKEMKTVAEEIFDCFSLQYEDTIKNDSYYIVSEEKPQLISMLSEYWNEAMELHHIEILLG